MTSDAVEVRGVGGSSVSAGSTSIASSECSDETHNEFDADSDGLFAVSEEGGDYLSSSFYNMLDVNAVSGADTASA